MTYAEFVAQTAKAQREYVNNEFRRAAAFASTTPALPGQSVEGGYRDAMGVLGLHLLALARARRESGS